MAIERLHEHASLTIDGHAHEVVALTGEEALSTLFRFEVTCALAGPPPDPAALLGHPTEIVLHDGFGVSRHVHGIVSAAEVVPGDDGRGELVVEIRPAAWRLTLGRDCRVFQESTVVDIVKEVVAAAKCPTRWETTASYPTRVYTVQYREDDWTFVARLLEEEGIYTWFDHGSGASVLVFSDTSVAAHELVGGAHIPFAWQSGARADGEIVEELGSGTEIVPDKFSVSSFDLNRPLLKVGASRGEGPLEIYRAPAGGPESPAVCESRARTLQEIAGAQKRKVAGLSSSVRLVPGRVFEISNHPIPRLDQRYLVTRASYAIEQRRRGATASADRAYQCHFGAIAAKTPFRAPQVTAPAEQPGAQSGLVVGTPGQEIHTDSLARVRVQQRWDRLGAKDHTAGKWMRVAQRGSAESMLFPRIGWTVLTFNEEGAIDAPTVYNRIPDAEHRPPYALPENKTRVVWKTATTPGGGSHNEIRFEDKKGLEEMYLEASRDMNVLVQHLKSEFVERDQTRFVGVNQTVNVGQRMLETVRRDQKVHIGAKETIHAAASAARTVGGNELEAIGGARDLTVGDSHLSSTQKTRSLTVGAAMIDVTLGEVTATAGLYTALVGGAVVKLSMQTITEDAGKASVQLVGGAKVEIAAKKRETDVKKRLFETVGGPMLLETADKWIDNAEKRWSLTAGAALSGKAPGVWIEATDEIVLRSGASVLTIKPDGVELRAPKFDLSSSPNLTLDAPVIEHN
jgi:type VI secretion system secreted protein VgrG